MDLIMWICGITLALLIISFGLYSHYTDSIIRDQERDIRKLQSENRRLQRALQAKNSKKVIQTPASTTEAKYEPIRYIPDYPDTKQRAKNISRDAIGGY